MLRKDFTSKMEEMRDFIERTTDLHLIRTLTRRQIRLKQEFIKQTARFHILDNVDAKINGKWFKGKILGIDVHRFLRSKEIPVYILKYLVECIGLCGEHWSFEVRNYISKNKRRIKKC